MFKNQVLNIHIFGGKIQTKCGSRFHQNWIFGQILRFCISVHWTKIQFFCQMWFLTEFMIFTTVCVYDQVSVTYDRRTRRTTSLSPRLFTHPWIFFTEDISRQSNSFTMSLEGYATLIFAILPLVFTDSSIDRYISEWFF